MKELPLNFILLSVNTFMTLVGYELYRMTGDIWPFAGTCFCLGTFIGAVGQEYYFDWKKRNENH